MECVAQGGRVILVDELPPASLVLMPLLRPQTDAGVKESGF
jgi:hypothetical protein